ncbi:HesA/MoeB/ThiF family protein [Leptospira biflexa]|uniref:HesA/MoeB/ThiF family protein n=1 Tax=Leptospira biflexa TaxID=172 RepID=UPI00108360FC|nr:HesA/MoeB/ThiF family protein [Leptospira biflexa]TGM34831.1 dinucleotide-utilizing protein [Leptospira biflexa]TGM42276.1 dinucleotide-utilizing protein [Leptospira biflexa]
MKSKKEIFFQRQCLVPEIGQEGQKKWNDASVLIIGLGGLGCPSALQLALAGVSRIGLVDFDVVEVSNLHRQTLFTWKDIGRKKTEVVSEVLKEHIPWIQIETFSEFLNSNSNTQIFETWDIVLDCTDTIISKYAINDFCLEKKIPLVTASVFRTSAQFAIFSGDGKPCYRCLFPNLSEGDTFSCNEGGVLGIQTSLAGNYQASLVLQYLLNPHQFELNTVYFIEWNPISFYQSKVEQDLQCPSCSEQRHLKRSEGNCLEIDQVGYLELKSKTSVILLDVREEEEVIHSPIPDAVWFPLSELEKGKSPPGISDQTIVCVCETGVRSLKATSYLTNFQNKFSLIGGRRVLSRFKNE